MDSAQADIDTLIAAVRAHPDFVFGTIFTQADFADPETGEEREIPEGFDPSVAEELIVERGNSLVDDAFFLP